jgi:hypothetical protein
VSNPIQDAATSLVDALESVEGLRAYSYGENVDPPAVLISPPTLTWGAYSGGPSAATFFVFLVVDVGDRSAETLWEFITPVAEAIESVRGAVVHSADPNVFNSGNAELPCYSFTVEVSL